ncbi:MAG: endopeptidase La [Gemmatimonadetes bacterium]|nr:endopeptidase La [Gemmatimonadota bacterium]
MAELPWNERSKEHLDLAEASRILDEDHYALGDVKDRVLEFLAVRQLRQKQDAEAQGSVDAEVQAEKKEEEVDAGESTDAPVATATVPPSNVPNQGSPDERAKGPILLFVGPPGVGKTSVAKSIARAMGRKYVRISLGGARDEADIRGHRRTYVGAMPGRIIQGMKQAGTRNPVFLLDEVDKLGVSFQGDPASALLEVLDPAQNDTFVDHYLGVPFDLSEVLFIATANFIQNIPGPLLDRMEVVDFAGYTEREKSEIARKYLIPRQFRENGVSPEQLEVTDDALSEVITAYTRESGVRQLERELGKLARKVARKIAAGEVQRITVDREMVDDLLGRPRVHPEKAARHDEIGVATGMYYTPTGGDIMFVEASTMRGKGELVLTGQLGDVMKESARAAWTYARSHAGGLQIQDEMFDRDIHIHVPAGAIPKDGPSAGVTMASAVVSTLSGRPVRHDIAMTGEITLRGRVLPIGGVKEKVLGAVRAGIARIILPKENEPDLEDLPKEVRDKIEVYLVQELGEVLALTLRGATFREGRLLFGDEKNPRDVMPLSSGFRH